MPEARGLKPGAWSLEPESFTMRDIVTLACTVCKRRNYSTTKNKKKTTDRLEFSKYCRFCRKHVGHRESK
jgi:large subunit ribosomal protein L33